ncbi:hypothetical protein [Paenibacillus sp. CMAA1364]
MNRISTLKSKHWFLVMFIYALILWLILSLHRFFFLNQPLDLIILMRYGLFALSISGIISAFGWFGAYYVSSITTIGILIGVILMYLYTNKDMSGWEDLAGFLTFIMMMVGGFVLGLIIEGIVFVIRWRRIPKT